MERRMRSPKTSALVGVIDYAKALGKPVKIINDAAMQALGSYDGGRMLFIGLGTAVGSALITENVVIPLELGWLNYSPKRKMVDMLERNALDHMGVKHWRKAVRKAIAPLRHAFVADCVVLGGGNAKKLKRLSDGVIYADSDNAYLGGIRLWESVSARKSSDRWRIA
jgi:polyphosphate glucokinase